MLERRIWLGRLLIVAGTVLWMRWAATLQVYGQLTSEARAGRLALVLLGGFLAWGLWRKLDQRTGADRLRRRRRREMAAAIDPRDHQVDGRIDAGVDLGVGARVNLGPCPACGGGPAVVTSVEEGVVQVRCRECGLVGAPPELQPLPRT